MKEIIRETVLGNQFWTLFQALAPMIWFYPLNELEISGYEAFAVVLFSPIFLGLPVIGRWIQNRWIIAFLRLVTLVGLASFQASTTFYRLFALSVGIFALMIVFTNSVFSVSLKERCITLWGLMLGLLLFISSRVWFTTFVPAWWSITSNSVVLAISTIAVFDKIITEDEKNSLNAVATKRNGWFVIAVGFGSLLYMTQAVFGDVSLVSRWVVSGFPETGPQPYPWGAVVLIALWFGAMLSPCSHVTGNFLWWLIGCLSYAALYYLPSWQGFAGGVVLAVFTMSIWPTMINQLSACPPARTMAVAALVWLVEMLFSVWTVAYNFVPGGVYTRERTDLLVLFIIVSLLLAHFAIRRAKESSHAIENRGKTFLLMFLMLLSGLAGFVHRYPQQHISHPAKSHPKADFTSCIWTYHFGYDNVGWPSLERSAEMLRDTGADVITLLESDASKPFLGNNDLGMWLGEKLGMYVDFGPSTRDHTWGNLMLSKYPFVKSVHHLLPSPHEAEIQLPPKRFPDSSVSSIIRWLTPGRASNNLKLTSIPKDRHLPDGELAPAIMATINMTGHLVDFVVTHMGNDRDTIDRDLQAKFLSSELRSAVNPVVFMGYVTSAPFSRDYGELTKHGNVKDIDNTDKERWCEYIMYRNLIRLGYARISHGGLSDTEVQVARFRIPENISNYTDNDQIVVKSDKVDQDVLFNPKFGKYRIGHNWIQDHLYHMSTPKYFVQEK